MTEHRKLEPATSHQRYMFSAEDYLLLDRSGAFRDHTKTELVGGTIYAVNAQYAPHARIHSLLFQALAAACSTSRSGLSAWIELSALLSAHDMPQPDIVLAKELPDEGPLPAADVAIAIEIAVSSLDFDLGKKQRAYATARVLEYWVADVNARMVHQFWSPRDGAYTERRTIPFGEPIEAATIEGLAVSTGTL